MGEMKRSLFRLVAFKKQLGVSSRSIHQDLKTQIQRFDASIPVEKAITPPSSWFTHQLFHDLDKEAIFNKEWVCVGRKDQVDEHGKFFSGCVTQQPFIVVNDNSEIKAFYNVCRHHAAQIVENDVEGCTQKFECPYHGWTYSTSGRLTKATRLKGIQDFAAKNFGLIPIQVDTWGPFIYINLSSSSNLHQQDQRRRVSDDFAEVGQQVPNFEQGLRFVKRVIYDMTCNWKVFVDNYLDGGYHVSFLHKDLTTGLDINSYETEVGDRYSLQKCKGSDADDAGQKDRLGSSAVFAYLYPNMMINRYGPWMDTNVVFPITKNTSRVIFDYYLEDTKWTSFANDDERQNYIKDCLKNSDQVQQEDDFICNAVQRGLESSAYDVGRYAPKVEMADHKFHLLLAQSYQNHLNK